MKEEQEKPKTDEQEQTFDQVPDVVITGKQLQDFEQQFNAIFCPSKD